MSKAAGVCTRCNGKYWLYDTSVEGDVPIPVPCVCLKVHFWASYLGADIFNSQAVVSHLYSPVVDPETLEISGDRTEDNLFIKGLWSDLKQHLKFVLFSKRKQFPNFTFEIIDDGLLVDVWLGRKAYNNHARQDRDSMVTYNSLRDLVSDPSLVIIRLGAMTAPNRAAPKVLMEALSIRFQAGAPTWLVEDWKPFGDGHMFYNEDVDDFIIRRFDIVDLGGDVKAEREARQEGEQFENGGTVAFDTESEPPPRVVPVSQYKERITTDRQPQQSKNAQWKKHKKGGGNNSGNGGKVPGPSMGI